MSSKKKLKQPKFTRKEFQDVYGYFKWFLMNFALKQIHGSDLGYQGLLCIARHLQKLDDEIAVLTEQGWVKRKLKEIKVKA